MSLGSWGWPRHYTRMLRVMPALRERPLLVTISSLTYRDKIQVLCGGKKCIAINNITDAFTICVPRCSVYHPDFITTKGE